MKKCQKCGKPADQLTFTLAHGPNGYRRYGLCPTCLKTPSKRTTPTTAPITKKEKKRGSK